MKEKFVVIIGALDTKGPEVEYCRSLMVREQVPVKVIDVGILGEPLTSFDVSRKEVALAGGRDIQSLIDEAHRGDSVEVMGRGANAIITQMQSEGTLAGVFGMGGSAGTNIAATAMKDLPLGLPKIIVSTLASGNTQPYVGIKDIVLYNSVVDVAGINQVSRLIFQNATASMVGMVRSQQKHPFIQDKHAKVIGVTMFGLTTPCAMMAKEYLESKGFEVLVFHATGVGGRTMESLVREGLIHGVLDITTTELADELVGGTLSAGPERLDIMGEMGIPHVIIPGAMDMVNFGGPETLPEKFKNRRLIKHNPQVTLMRTTADENSRLGKLIAEKVNSAPKNRRTLIPLQGFSDIDRANGPFGDPDANQAFVRAMQDNLRSHAELKLLDNHINDKEFAICAAQTLENMMN